MTKAERKIIGKYMRSLADALELRDWEVVLSHEPAAEGTFGQARCRYGAKRIEVRLAADFRETSLEEQRDTLVHELIHAHLDGNWKFIEEDVLGAFGREASALVMAGYTRSLEVGVDGLTKALAKHLPLIDWSQT